MFDRTVHSAILVLCLLVLQGFKLEDGPPSGLIVSEAVCEGNIDRINGQAAAPAIKIANFIYVEGWTTISGKDGTTPDEVYVTLRAEDGRVVYVKSEQMPRPDVQAYFGQPKMGPAGFAASITDTSSLKGDVTLGVARKIGERIERCNNFSVSLYRGEGPRPPAAAAPKSEPLRYDPIDESVSALREEVNVSCEGYIETLNGALPDPAENMISGTMQVQGWTTISGKDAIVPDAVFVRIGNQQGKTVYIKTRPSPRDDVRRFFGQPKLPNAGFLASIETSKLEGTYTIGVSRLYQGTLERCDGLSFPVTIRH